MGPDITIYKDRLENMDQISMTPIHLVLGWYGIAILKGLFGWTEKYQSSRRGAIRGLHSLK